MFLDTIVDRCHRNMGSQAMALEYLRSRYVTSKDVTDYRLGCASVIVVPDDGSDDRSRFMDETHKGRDFERKIIFPITDMLDRVVGLAGRGVNVKEFKTFVTDEAKYQGFFFGLSQALPYIYQDGRVYAVEGLFDVLAFRKAFPNVVGTITAGLNKIQHAMLSMFCKKIIVCFDSDPTGDAARERAMEWKNVEGMPLGYKDPALCLETLGTEGFVSYVRKKSEDIFPF